MTRDDSIRRQQQIAAMCNAGVLTKDNTRWLLAELGRLDAEVERLRAGLREIAELDDWYVWRCPGIARRLLNKSEAS